MLPSLLGCSPHHSLTVCGVQACLHLAWRAGGQVGWLEHTHSYFTTATSNHPPSDIFDAFHPSNGDSLAARTLPAPIRIETRRQQQVAAARSNTPSPAPLSCCYLTRLTWSRDWFEHLAERGTRESTASTRLRRRP